MLIYTLGRVLNLRGAIIMAIENNKFTFDYSKYRTGLTSDQLRIMIAEAVKISGVTNTVLYCLKSVIIMILSDLLHKQVDIEKEKERQDWESAIASGSQTNVDV